MIYSKKTNRNNAPPRPDDDFQSVILDLARVTRVQRGGKRLRFRVTVGLGNKKGTIGIGIAKGADVSMAVEKATRRARKNVIQIKITEDKSIPHNVTTKYKASLILLKPAPAGTGLKAGGVIRTLCDLVGIENISAKILGSNNKICNSQALINAFSEFKH
ncbi:MAG: hypothetical protein A2445_04135 [Candidatus Jacksonbacteria bacterium RIFOXYC2_FULL_44_29]|nr:MAG: 30S ribosomal protein S5 [Parcubacteria group bacterium GW2011_GWA2_42_28]KKT56223.1 MAG: 30S ribosomal protein S5 [Parcubacteria group bacterium GW2011_GWC2_44_22]OGY76129.1 MAG: hypothetical protein A2240_00355 [Candidatus Jacksonbacteria bacterium RIFOXYA2_FULL_43_12]OGY77720.1 MAG: hypothetical protein A2295_02855 [Candidatus Jacksonbacteria bacterium RIFOXYB2_FULL_44_15]OGY78856.1 MAG: hypothetical protein A2550_04920 [Candidatus Jacksonbacteria bacterium RIFOXYD2_FULL_43_21]OGY80